MGHRYLTGTLGALTLAVTLWSWKAKRSRRLVSLLLALLLLQATLGAWTVTMLLKPAIATAHLLGGMALLGTLAWLALSQSGHRPTQQARQHRVPAAIALGVLAVQIALGGWVS